jgi:hypothetical protein
MDSTLLKEAIADAKAVRQTALANAKVALEEAFSERYQAMFAEKLKEDAEMGTAQPQAEEQVNAQGNVSEQEIDELIKELESEVGQEPAGEPYADDAVAGAIPGAAPAPAQLGLGAPSPVPGAPVPPVPGTVPPGCPPGCPPVGGPPVGGIPGAQVPQMGIDAAGSGAPVPPLGAPPVGAPSMSQGAPSPALPPSDVPPAEDEQDEDVDLNELLEQLKGEVEGEEEDDKIEEQTKLASSGIGSGKAGKPSSAASSTSKIESAANDDEGYPTIDQPKVVSKEATQAGRPNQAKNATKDNLSTPAFGGKGGNGGGGQSETGMPKTDQVKTTAKEATQASRPNQAKNATATNLSTPGGMLQENQFLKRQLNEAEEVIRYVKGQLNEVNLLNAKLLYTNKLFKEYNMNNEQKMRIVEMFDLSKNVREVKLTYANIAESLNFSGGDMKKKAKANSNVQSITEGLASGAVGSTKPSKELISEGKTNQMVSKFQRLAGIKMPKK